MIDVQISHFDGTSAAQEPEALQQYVRALLSRQHALDLLDVIHLQINQVWGTIRKLLECPTPSGRLTQAIRAARAAQAVQAKNTYRSLEKRREECIAALHEAERRANTALQSLLATRPKKPASKPVSATPCRGGLKRSSRRKIKNLCSEPC